MQIHGANAAISLETEQSLRIQSSSHVDVACLSGLLWVTQPGDVRDLFVAPGEPLRLAASELTLITAMVPSVLRVREVPAAAGWRPLLRSLSRLVALPVTALEPGLGSGQDRWSVR